MKGPHFHFRILLALNAVALLLAGCANANDVNAAFRQSRVTWFVFDAGTPTGLKELAGFDQSTAVHWVPRDRGVRATDVAPAPGGGGAVAVAHLGLVLVDDQAGLVTAVRPGAKVPLDPYQTDRLFLWGGKLFLTLGQTPPGAALPATLGWWVPGQARLALFPVPSQIQNPARQAVGFVVPSGREGPLGITWKWWDQGRWTFEQTVLTLDGTEGVSALAPAPERPLPAAYDGLRAKVSERLGAEVVVEAAQGGGPPLVFSEAGWVAAQAVSDGRPRLFRLPDLGIAGRYTGAVFLSKGWVFTWETSFRGYSGAAGLLHVPAPVLAP